jgi:hypothetical protein
MATCNAVQQIKQEDKQEIRFNIIDAHDLVQEMEEWKKATGMQQQQGTTTTNNENNNNQMSPEDRRDKAHLVMDTGLTVLAKKYGHQQSQQTQQKEQKTQQKDQTQSDDPVEKSKSNNNLALLCQQAAYISLHTFPNDDVIVAGSLALLALVAKDERIRERHIYQADDYGLNIPIDCMRRSFQRAQEKDQDDDNNNNGNNNNKQEQFAAELQRKACLLLGALASDDVEMAISIVNEGGLEAILDAVNWYRHHAEVCNWGCWAVFILCYENPTNKVAVVQLDGVPIVIQTMRNCKNNLQVARHGIAIIFDLLRENDACKLDTWAIRKVAIEAGLHPVITNAMDVFCDQMDIMMMGQEILAGTGFNGEVPQFLPGANNM